MSRAGHARSDRRYKVVLWAPLPPPPGGIGRWCLRYRAEAEANNVELDIVDVSPRTETYSVESRLSLGRVKVAGHAFVELAAALRKKPDVAHLVTSLKWATPREAIAMAMCKAAGVPIVLHLRVSTQTPVWRKAMSPWRRNAVDRVLRMADVLLVLSKELQDYFAEQLPGARVDRIGNMISPAERAAESTGRVLPERTAPIRVVFVGMVTPDKGITELCRACIDLPDVEVVLIGGPGDDETSRQDEMLQALERMRATGRLVETGQMPHADVTCAYRESDIFCLPTYMEGMPNVLLEAMAAGLPSISTPVGGVPDVLEGDAGILVPVGDAKALRGAIEQLASDPAEREKWADAGRQRINDRYTTEAVIGGYKAIYERLIPRPAPGSDRSDP